METECARCEASVPVDQTYFSAVGEVCFRCNTELESASSATFAAGAQDSGNFGAHGGTGFSTSRQNDDGSVSTFRVNGVLGLILTLLKAIFGRR